MATRNMRKMQVLSILASGYAYTPRHISEALGVEIHNARMLLKRYAKQGLLNKAKTRDGALAYWINEKGMQRLAWLKRNMRILS
jgi:DNA-binding MarR family transcriptional regulator